jgi:hypothetical protein
MMILHGSSPKRSCGVRRTVYIEFRPADGVRESKAQSEHWIELRKRWMGLVLRQAESADWPREWRDDLPSDLGTVQEEARDVGAHWEPPIPAVYHHENIETADYPVPADMRGQHLDAG